MQKPSRTTSIIAILYIWVNLLSPGLAAFYLLPPHKTIELLGVELLTLLFIYGLLIINPYITKVPLTILSAFAPFNVWYILTFHATLSAETLQFCLTMPAKAYSEALLSVIDTPSFLTALVVSGVSGLLCWQKINDSLPIKTRRAMLSIALLIAAVVLVDSQIVVPIKPHPPLVAMSTAVSAFPSNIFQVLSGKLLPQAHAQTGQRKTAVKVLREGETEKETVVYVVGESARSDHWHKNGYGRQTTPFLDKENILNFAKVRSISDCTNLSVPGLLGMLSAKELYDLSQSCQDGSTSGKSKPGQSNFSGVPGHATLFDYFRGAGFFTSAIINYNQDTIPINEVGAEIDHIDITPKDTRYDTQMLPYLDKTLEGPFNKKFIVMHSYGSHWQYAKRYPHQFDRFRDNSSQFQEHMAYYDNSILATDSFLHDVLGRLKSVPGKVVLVYTSDHGDGDDKKMELHCSVPSNYTTLVPLFFWTNTKLSADKGQKLSENADRYLSQDSIATTLLDMVGIIPEKINLNSALTRETAQAKEYYSYGSDGKLYSCTLEGCREAP